MPDCDPLYLFLCHLEWQKHRHVAEYNQLLAALDDINPAIRQLAESLIQRTSPLPRDHESHLQESATRAESSREY
jgi:hypothetical protein